MDRLTSVTPTTGTSESYAFDAVGNRTASHLSASYTHQPFNKLTATANNSFAYNANGNQTSKTEASGTWQYEWDYENRLKKATAPNGDYVVYKYDALGRRIERAPSVGVSTKFTCDGQDVILDVNSDGTTVSYLNGLGIDNKLRQTVGGQAQYFLSDHLGSTNALTDSTGAILTQTNYDAFGNATNANFPTRYQFTGREFDSFTGLHHYRARQYSAELGRFISEDPIGFAGGNVNLYGYVWNSSMKFTDPTGFQASGGFQFKFAADSRYKDRDAKWLEESFNDMRKEGCECRKSFEGFGINLDDLYNRGIIISSGEPFNPDITSQLSGDERRELYFRAGAAKAVTITGAGYNATPHIFFNSAASRGFWGNYGDRCALRQTFAHELMHAGGKPGVERGVLFGNDWLDAPGKNFMGAAGFDDLTYLNGWWDKPYNRLLSNCGCQ